MGGASEAEDGGEAPREGGPREGVTGMTRRQPDGTFKWRWGKACRLPLLVKGTPIRRARGWNLQPGEARHDVADGTDDGGANRDGERGDPRGNVGEGGQARRGNEVGPGEVTTGRGGDEEGWEVEERANGTERGRSEEAEGGLKGRGRWKLLVSQAAREEGEVGERGPR